MSHPRKKRSDLIDDGLRAFRERTAKLTHDLANALGALQLRLDLLGNDPACTNKQRHHIEAIRGICALATTSVGELHDFASKTVNDKRSC